MLYFFLAPLIICSLGDYQGISDNFLKDLLSAGNDYYELDNSIVEPSGNIGVQPQKLQDERRKNSLLPAYCDPPNPCPLGYTAQDGCIENFDNKADFSRQYQSSQSCMCDTEHMFSCPTPGLDIYGMEKREESGLDLPENPFSEEAENPYLAGVKLPIAAKKGFGY